MRGSAWLLRLAETCPALSVHSATLSVIQRTCAQAASRLARSAAPFGFGKVYWCGIAQTTACLNRRGTGTATKSTLASRRPAKFQEPAIHMPSRPAMKASRQLVLAGGATLCWFGERLPELGDFERGGIGDARALEIGRVDVGAVLPEQVVEAPGVAARG